MWSFRTEVWHSHLVTTYFNVNFIPFHSLEEEKLETSMDKIEALQLFPVEGWKSWLAKFSHCATTLWFPASVYIKGVIMSSFGSDIGILLRLVDTAPAHWGTRWSSPIVLQWHTQYSEKNTTSAWLLRAPAFKCFHCFENLLKGSLVAPSPPINIDIYR